MVAKSNIKYPHKKVSNKSHAQEMLPSRHALNVITSTALGPRMMSNYAKATPDMIEAGNNTDILGMRNK